MPKPVDGDLRQETKMQAVVLADSFASNFRPVTFQQPKVLMPLVNVPMLEYTCDNTVAAEHERIISLIAPVPSDGPKRGSTTDIDVIEDCPLICKVEVQGRKAPLRVYFEFEGMDLDETKKKR